MTLLPLFTALGLLSCLYILGTILAIVIKNNAIADVIWGPGFIVLALTTLFLNNDWALRQVIVNTLVIIWGTRLAFHIGLRTVGKPEDSRYAQWRKAWGNWALIRTIMQVFLLQGLILVIIALPALYINLNDNTPLNMRDVLAILLWSIGFCCEALGDYQLSQFIKKAENKGRIMKYGIWRYTRHPNYFGEIVIWWSIWLLATSVPGGWVTIISPAMITYLIIFVSGIPMAENQFATHPEFQEYKKMTSILIPWFTRTTK